ncbi:MAG: hypothetical protein A3F80_05195 [Candidatus Melainabacteria bacterium RIFCSPLOWO2_12_FULL_35_11]|nr:MAG: hypothetical protein A3F80_05195 [Candidatus Melainabacteria bacterium RIFCSPLOWO2_12_FULL_35_11]
MDKKQYKVKYENGKLTPLEPIRFNERKEGIVIFFDEEIGTFQDKATKESKASLSENSLKKIWDNPEDEVYNDL